ncbi:MAG: hypothetical protein HN350_00070 [Phycisphaerales bacterium]|jgi:hypothetical protein|nr:hypothetical protein [Phycisphaerales bacterium]
MSFKTGKILKRDEVTVAGHKRLGVSGPTRSPDASEAQPQGRIVEQTENGAVVEITCGCGRVFHLNCVYAGQ